MAAKTITTDPSTLADGAVFMVWNGTTVHTVHPVEGTPFTLDTATAYAAGLDQGAEVLVSRNGAPYRLAADTVQGAGLLSVTFRRLMRRRRI